jgi:hypothetical protein
MPTRPITQRILCTLDIARRLRADRERMVFLTPTSRGCLRARPPRLDPVLVKAARLERWVVTDQHWEQRDGGGLLCSWRS